MSSSTEFFNDLMSPQKEVRESAEKKLPILKAAPIAESIKVFHEGMSNDNVILSQFAALILKKIYLDDKERSQSLTNEEKNSLIALIKSQIDFKKPWKSLQRLADALALLYQITSLPVGFNEIVAWFSNQTEAVSRKFAVYLIEVLCDAEALKDNVIDDSAVTNFLSIFGKGLNDEDINVRVSSLKAATQFLNNWTKEEIIMKFTSLSDKMLEALVAAWQYEKNNEGSSTTGKTAIETINYLIDRHWKFWKGKTEMIIDIVCQISSGKIFQNSIRESSLEWVFSIAKNSPGVLKKSTKFVQQFIPMLFQLLWEIDNINTPDKWEKQVEEDEGDLDDMFYGMRDSFERLSIDLGGKFIMESTASYIKKLMTSDNWIEVHAGYTALAFMSEGCKEVYKSNWLEILNYISNGWTNQSPRVRYAALGAFGCILKETAPKPQKEYTNNILPALAQLMSDKETSIRVKTQSCNALVEFLRGWLNDKDEEANEKILAPYSGDWVKFLSQLFELSLKISYSPLQETTLSSISLLSHLLEKNFAPYYDMLMPGLKKLFYSLEAKTSEQKTLKSNCIETIAFLCSSVSENREKYLNDLNEISSAFTKSWSTLPEEDPQLATILNSYSHISLSMQEKFTPVLKEIIPLLQNFIMKDIGLQIKDADLNEYIPEDQPLEGEKGKIGSVIWNVGTKNTMLSLHTFAIQNKILAFNVLNEIAFNMKSSFFEFNEILLKFAKEFLSFPYSRKIRKIAIKSIVSCLEACKEESNKLVVLNFIGEDLNKVFAKNIKMRYLREVKTYLKYINLIAVNIKAKEMLPQNFVMELYNNFNDAWKFVDSLKTEIITKVTSGKFDEDEEDEDTISEEFDSLNEMSRRVMEASGNIFKLIKEPLTALITEKLYQSFLNSWQSAISRNKLKSDQEILSSICFFCDYFENGDITAVKMTYHTFIDICLAYKTANEDIIQSNVFGLGLISARLDKEEFNAVKGSVLKYISDIIQRNVTDDNKATFDNAVGAMGKFIYFQCDNDDNGNAMAQQFIKLLPLKNDLEESKSVCRDFFKAINDNNTIIVNDRNVALIKEALRRIKELNDNESFLEEQEILLREICGKLGL